MTKVNSIFKSKDIILLTKVHISQSYGFSSSHVRMWVLYHKEGWALRNWCFWSVVLGKTLESPLDNKKIKPVNPKGNQSWIFNGRTEAEAEAPILWPLVQKANSLEKTLKLGMIEEKRRRGQQRMRWLDGTANSTQESQQILGDSEGKGTWHATVHSVGHNLAIEQQERKNVI